MIHPLSLNTHTPHHGGVRRCSYVHHGCMECMYVVVVHVVDVGVHVVGVVFHYTPHTTCTWCVRVMQGASRG